MPDPSTPYITPYCIVVDTREQAPFKFTGFQSDSKQGFKPLAVRTVSKGLKTGDYSVEGYESDVCIERKSKADAWSTFSMDRDRFERELERMATFKYAAVVIECSMNDLISESCPECNGIGRVPDAVQAGVAVSLKLNEFDNFMDRRLYEVIRIKQLTEIGWLRCERCDGKGQLQPVERSKFNPKALYRSIVAWRQRYGVHFITCDSRRYAEAETLRSLERFYLDAKEVEKQKGE